MYETTQKLVRSEVKSGFGIDLVLDDPDGARKAIDTIWCADGKNWSTRIWNNKALLQQRIEKGLLDSVMRGVPKDEAVKQLMKDFGTGFSNADRLIRTEMTYVQNKSAADRYRNNGVQKYEYLAAMDDKTSEKCAELNGKQFLFSEMKVGENFPPSHPRCRCTIIPVIE